MRCQGLCARPQQAGNLSHASFRFLLWVSHVQDCDFSLGHTRKGREKDRQRITLQILQKPLENGNLSEMENKTKQRKRAIKKELELVLLPSYQPSSLTRDCLLFIFTDGLLRHTKTGEAFVFNAREDLHRWNQKRYEALGEVI